MNKKMKVQYIGESNQYLSKYNMYLVLEIYSRLDTGVVSYRILDNFDTLMIEQSSKFISETISIDNMKILISNNTIVITHNEIYELAMKESTYNDVWEKFYGGNQEITKEINKLVSNLVNNE